MCLAFVDATGLGLDLVELGPHLVVVPPAERHVLEELLLCLLGLLQLHVERHAPEGHVGVHLEVFNGSSLRLERLEIRK